MPLNYSVVLVVVWKKGEPRVRDAGVAADERKLAFLYHNGGGVEPWDGETCAKTLANFALLVARGWTFVRECLVFFGGSCIVREGTYSYNTATYVSYCAQRAAGSDDSMQ